MANGVSSIRVKPEHVEDIAILLHNLPSKYDLLEAYSPFEDDIADWTDAILDRYGLTISEPNKKSPYVLVNITSFDDNLTILGLHTIAPYVIDGSELEWFFKESLFAKLNGHKKFKYKNGVMAIHSGHTIVVYDEKNAEADDYQKIQMVSPIKIDNPFEDDEEDNPFRDDEESYASKIAKTKRRREALRSPHSAGSRRRLKGSSK